MIQQFWKLQQASYSEAVRKRKHSSRPTTSLRHSDASTRLSLSSWMSCNVNTQYKLFILIYSYILSCMSYSVTWTLYRERVFHTFETDVCKLSWKSQTVNRISWNKYKSGCVNSREGIIPFLHIFPPNTSTQCWPSVSHQPWLRPDIYYKSSLRTE